MLSVLFQECSVGVGYTIRPSKFPEKKREMEKCIRLMMDQYILIHSKHRCSSEQVDALSDGELSSCIVSAKSSVLGG
jgi:hypothetical protein